MRFRFLNCGLAAAVTAAPALAALNLPITQLLRDGDNVPGVGNVTFIDRMAVNNSGAWVIQADTDFATTPGDGVVLAGFQTGSGALAYREAQALSSPAGATISSFGSLTLNDSGNIGWNLFLDGTLGGNDDSGIYFNSNLVIQEGTASSAAGFGGVTPYIGFFRTYINSSNQLGVVASVDDPTVASTVDRALVRISNPGGVPTETLIAREGSELLPGRFVTDFNTSANQSDFSDAGFLYFADLDGDTLDDGTIWLDNTLIARENSPSPVAGRNYQTLSSRPMAVSNNGDIAFRADLDGGTTDDELIVVNNTVVAREGGTLPDIAGFTFTGFGTGPVDVDDNGNVLWFGDWNDADTTRDTGLFLNDQLIVQEGVTMVNGVILDEVRAITDGYAFSPNGDWIIVRGVLVGGADVAFLIAVPEPASALLLVGGLALAFRRR